MTRLRISVRRDEPALDVVPRSACSRARHAPQRAGHVRQELVALSGVARQAAPRCRLDQRQPGTPWEQVRPIAPGPGGSVRVPAEAARADRLPARQRRGLPARSRTSRSLRSCGSTGCPTHDAARLRDGRSSRRASVALQRFDGATLEVDRACDDRPERRLRGAREPDSGQYRAQARARPGLRARREPDADGRGRHEAASSSHAFLLALAVPAQASAARFAIGIQKRTDEQRPVARRVRL